MTCRATTWKYESLPVGPTEGQGPPPPGAEDEAKENLWKQARVLTRSQVVDIDGLCKRLDAKEPIVFSVRTFRNWDFQVVQETGEVPMPLPGATPDGGHAIVLVGYEFNSVAPGGGAFIFRNSWGKDWGACAAGTAEAMAPFLRLREGQRARGILLKIDGSQGRRPEGDPIVRKRPDTATEASIIDAGEDRGVRGCLVDDGQPGVGLRE